MSVVGIDRAAEAIEFARANYRLPNLSFEAGSCTSLPHARRRPSTWWWPSR